MAREEGQRQGVYCNFALSLLHRRPERYDLRWNCRATISREHGRFHRYCFRVFGAVEIWGDS